MLWNLSNEFCEDILLIICFSWNKNLCILLKFTFTVYETPLYHLETKRGKITAREEVRRPKPNKYRFVNTNIQSLENTGFIIL